MNNFVMNSIVFENSSIKLNKFDTNDLFSPAGFDKTDSFINSIKTFCNYFDSANISKSELLNLLEFYFEATYSGYEEIDRKFILCLINDDLKKSKCIFPELKKIMIEDNDESADEVFNSLLMVVLKSIDDYHHKNLI